jgi:hypothetical protein
MPYLTYKLLHLLGVFLTLVALGGMATRAGSSGGKSGADRMAGALHGIGLLIVLVAGFGLLARLGVPWPWPLWIWLKLGIWLLLGASVVAIRRSRLPGHLALIGIPLLAATAAFLALFKP